MNAATEEGGRSELPHLAGSFEAATACPDDDDRVILSVLIGKRGRSMYNIALVVLAVGQAQAADPSESLAPERDARGIPVVSQEPNVPAGVNQPVPDGVRITFTLNQSQYLQMRAATVSYPPCSRGQTDRCVQSYERHYAVTRCPNPHDPDCPPVTRATPF